MKKWIDYKGGFTVGEKGSEDGVILKDQEFDESCRITLERCPKYHAITCGIYGAMVHTVFCSPEEAEITFDEMKKELGKFLSTPTTEDEECEFYEDFCSRFY